MVLFENVHITKDVASEITHDMSQCCHTMGLTPSFRLHDVQVIGMRQGNILEDLLCAILYCILDRSKNWKILGKLHEFQFNDQKACLNIINFFTSRSFVSLSLPIKLILVSLLVIYIRIF